MKEVTSVRKAKFIHRNASAGKLCGFRHWWVVNVVVGIRHLRKEEKVQNRYLECERVSEPKMCNRLSKQY